ncbi:MAG TPA: hypothetical protein DCS43_08915 [Verrucomicrobia bacterium]|nr:hypothetical protein [Verrucomicrobiota bacterium]
MSGFRMAGMLVMAATVCAAAIAQQENGTEASEWTPGLSGGVDVANSYVFKGMTYNDGLVIQPWGSLSLCAFDLTVWANYDADDYNGNIKKNETSEVDIRLTYTFDIGAVRTVAGYVFWIYPNSSLQDDQLATVDFSCALGEAARLGLYAEYMTAGTIEQTWYAKPYATYTVEMTEDLSFELLGQLGYTDNQAHEMADGWMHYDLKTTAYYKLFSLSAAYVGRLDSDVLPNGEFFYDTEWLFTAGVSFDY